MKSEEKAEIEKIIALKASEENLSNFEKAELIRLQIKHYEYTYLDAAASQKLLEDEMAPKRRYLFDDEALLGAFLDDYKYRCYDRYRFNDEFYEPEIKDMSLAVYFPDEETEKEFAFDEAEHGMKFVIYDGRTNNVVAFSNTDGNLYHGGFTEFKRYDKFKLSPINRFDFVMPGADTKCE